MTHTAVVFAEPERDFIRSRTREALAVRKDPVPTAQGGHAWSQATVRAPLMREGVH